METCGKVPPLLSLRWGESATPRGSTVVDGNAFFQFIKPIEDHDDVVGGGFQLVLDDDEPIAVGSDVEVWMGYAGFRVGRFEQKFRPPRRELVARSRY